MKHLLTYGLMTSLLLVTQTHFGQIEITNKDSLLVLLEKAKKDTNQVYLLVSIGQQYENSQPDSAAYYYQKAGKLSEALEFPHGIIKYISNYTYLLNLEGKYEASLKLNLESVEISKKNKLKRDLGICYGNVASVYQYMNNYEKAVEYYQFALPIFEELNDKASVAILNSNLASVYGDLKQYKDAVQYGEKAINFYKSQRNAMQLAITYINVGAILGVTNDFKKSLEYFKTAYQLSKKADYPQGIESSLINMGDVFSNPNTSFFNPDEAIRLYTEALPLAKKINDEEGVATVLQGLSQSCFQKKEFKTSENYWQQSYDLASKMNFSKRLKFLYLLKSDLELAQGNFKTAFGYREKFDSLSQILVNENLLKNIQNLEAKYQSEKKEAQIKTLEQEKQIQNLNFQKQNTFTYFLIGSFLTLLLISFLSYRNYKNTQTIQTQKIRELEQERQILAADSILKGQEDERSRLAKDLHDGLGGMLSSVKMALSTFSNTFFMKGNQILPEESAQGLERAISMLDNSIQELRSVARNLMPEALVKFGLKDALQDFIENINQSSTLKIDYQAFGLENRLEQNTEIIVFRIVQELLNNAIKHANASQILIQLVREENRLSLTVEDNGKGLDTKSLETAKGIGWTNIQSRVNYLDGKLDIDSQPEKGTSVHIELPV